MWSLTRSLSVLCLGTLLMLAAACTGNGAGVTTASVEATTARATASGTGQLTRSVEVATTAACAKAYGYSVDPVRLRDIYLGYESKQGASREQLRAIEQSYDTAYQQVAGPQSSSCSRMDAATVKSDIQRYASGYFAPRTPQPKEVFDVNKVWADQECGGRC
jgi:uncharacterized protein YdbL (DUF1318 family)